MGLKTKNRLEIATIINEPLRSSWLLGKKYILRIQYEDGTIYNLAFYPKVFHEFWNFQKLTGRKVAILCTGEIALVPIDAKIVGDNVVVNKDGSLVDLLFYLPFYKEK